MTLSLRKLSRTERAGATLAGLAALVLGAPPTGAQVVEEIAIAAGLASDMPAPAWRFIVEVEGSGLASGTVTPPAGGSLPLTDAAGDGLELEFEGDAFASFAALQAVHPPGDYRVTVNGVHSVTLAWNPIQPVGAGGDPSVAIITPADGAMGASSMPDVTFALDCTNCNDLNLELQSLAGPIFGFGQLDAPTFLNPIPFAAMELRSSGAETELPDGPVDAELLVGLVDFADLGFDPPSGLPPFTYVEAAAVTTASTFTVPEPAGPVAIVTALATLGVLGRRATSRPGRGRRAPRG